MTPTQEKILAALQKGLRLRRGHGMTYYFVDEHGRSVPNFALITQRSIDCLLARGLVYTGVENNRNTYLATDGGVTV